MNGRPQVISGDLSAPTGRRWPLRRLMLMLVATLAFCGLLSYRLRDLDPAKVAQAMAQVPPQSWLLSLVATAISFWALGQYDVAAHRHLGTQVPAGQARVAGLCGIALSQILGLGVVTGALVRWRLMPSLGLWQAGRVTLVVSLLFLAGWAVVTAVAVLATGGPMPGAALVVLCAAAVAVALALSQKAVGAGWPNLYTQTRVLALAALDCGAAAAAFWLLCPGEMATAPFLAAFLLALGAGLVSGTPGGIGAFELTLMALLPNQPEAPLLAAILAWRAIYYLLPALLALLLVLRGPIATRRPDVLAPVPDTPAFPEAGLMRQGRFQPLIAGDTLFAAARTPHALIALREPLAGGAQPAHLRALMARAERESRAGIVYKATPRMALQARRLGMAVLPLSRDAWLSPPTFALDHPSRAGLRRKLRKAAQAGVLARCGTFDLPELARLNADWVAARGGEQGFSLGRFDPVYLTGQRIYVARIGPRAVGFASFHATPAGWALDLMRPHPTAPEGTAQALIAAAIDDAARAGVSRLSLAAVPESAFGPNTLAARITRLLPGGQATARGLWQFKTAFAPRWERLYLIAPSWPAMALAGVEIRHAITHPGRLAPPAEQVAAPKRAENGFASRMAAWQRKQG
jgi:phosphatidylglycerol lysyltransferase